LRAAALIVHGVGIIGLGVMGRTMATAMAEHPAFRVVGAYDPASAPGMAIHWYGSAQAIVSDAAVGCVYIASPPGCHLEHVRLAAAARKPILCEKPLAASIDEARDCLAAVTDAGMPAAANFYFAATDAAVRLRRLVRRGALGELRSARLVLRFKQWPRPWQSAAGNWLSLPAEGGFTREVVSHFLFLAQRMFGPGQCAAAQMAFGDRGTESRLAARIRYEGLTLEIDGAVAGDRDDHNRLALVGSRGEAALVDWDRLEFAGDAGPRLPESHMLDSLAAMLEGRPHELAAFSEAAAIVELTESVIGRATRRG
jgi:predicted dehydrogenase